jgi:ribosomal protein S27E
MADELIRCPACSHELRVPPELLGKTVECPQCGSRFLAPSAGGAPVVRAVTPTYEGFDGSGPQMPASGRSLRAPAIALLVTAGLALLLSAYSLISAEENVRQMKQLAADPNTPQEIRDFMQRFGLAENVDVDSVRRNAMIMMFLNGVTVLGAIMMLKLQGYWIAVIGAVLALNPLNCPCCFLQVPFGIWALVALFGSDAKRAMS